MIISLRARRLFALLAVWCVIAGLLLFAREPVNPFKRNVEGQLRWKCQVPNDPGLVHRQLVVDEDGTVYALGNTLLTAVSSAAKVLWAKPLNGYGPSDNLGQLVVDEYVVYAALGRELTAFPLTSMTKGWTVQHSGKDNMYVAMVRHGNRLYVYSGQELSTYSLEGKLISRRTFAKHTESSMATDPQGNLYLSVAGHGADLNSYQVLALDSAGTEIWRTGKLPPVKDVVFGSGRVYVGTYGGLFCLDLQGNKLWSMRNGLINSVLIDEEGVAYCAFDGKPFGAESLCAIDGAGKQLWLVNNVGGAALNTLGTANPVFWKKRIYIATSEMQTPPSSASWSEQLLTKLSGGRWSAPQRAPLQHGRVMSFEAATGQMVWEKVLPEPIVVDLAIDKRGKGLIVTSSNNFVYALNP